MINKLFKIRLINPLTLSGMTQKSMFFSPSAGPNVRVPLKGNRSVLFMSTNCQSTVTVPYLPMFLKMGTWAVIFRVGVLSSEMNHDMLVIGATSFLHSDKNREVILNCFFGAATPVHCYFY